MTCHKRHCMTGFSGSVVSWQGQSNYSLYLMLCQHLSCSLPHQSISLFSRKAILGTASNLNYKWVYATLGFEQGDRHLWKRNMGLCRLIMCCDRVTHLNNTISLLDQNLKWHCYMYSFPQMNLCSQKDITKQSESVTCLLTFNFFLFHLFLVLFVQVGPFCLLGFW